MRKRYKGHKNWLLKIIPDVVKIGIGPALPDTSIF